MQIIIVQSEIETAIRNHILSLIDVKEGARIDIDLSATRGADGFKATIDIVSGDAVKPEPTKAAAPAEEPAPQVAQDAEASKVQAPEKNLRIAETVRRARAPKATPAAAPAAQAAEPSQADASTEAPFEEDNTPAGTGLDFNAEAEAGTQVENDPEIDRTYSEETETDNVVQAEEAPAPAAPARSLFANLGKSINE